MKVINTLKIESFRNAIKLFRDACLLAEHGRNETAYAVAVLSYEEIGKSALADRQLDRICLNPGSEEYARKDIQILMKSHNRKQSQAAFDTDSKDYELSKKLDLKKQRAIYVDYDGVKVTTPSISKEELKNMLGEVYRALNDIGDLPYYGIAGVPSKKSEWMDRKDIEEIKKDYEKIKCL